MPTIRVNITGRTCLGGSHAEVEVLEDGQVVRVEFRTIEELRGKSMETIDDAVTRIISDAHGETLQELKADIERREVVLGETRPRERPEEDPRLEGGTSGVR